MNIRISPLLRLELSKTGLMDFSNKYGSHKLLLHLYTLLDLTQTLTRLKYGSMYIINIFIQFENIHNLETLPLGNITSLKANVYNIGKIHRILETKK